MKDSSGKIFRLFMCSWTRSVGLFLEWTCHGVVWLLLNGLWLWVLWIYSVDFTPPGSKLTSSAPRWSFSRWLAGPDPLLFPNPWSKAFCLLFALLFDMSLVGIMKGFVRRPRPEEDVHGDMRLTVRQDLWSFPSGHASRAVLLLWLLPSMFIFSQCQYLLLLMWSGAICLSRYTMRRHHATDVVAGCLLGFFEYQFTMLIHWPSILHLLWFGR
ncbi:hypothetical protein P879_06031 [Paragonimus westermani]|uniref:Phosphatidic acid phosphatase type 2/haloperoxidase domain-containing protein n=1 Tax=Paragonimus westermani TaxID=34504 RepID=A0A8T0DNA7_9TREM|nr:hypothetical protein P879_06031 [Paragonimus westermani]